MTRLRFALNTPIDYPKIPLDGWRNRALCADYVKRGALPAWVWDDKAGADGDQEDAGTRRRRINTATEVCDRCPVKNQCLADVDLSLDEGVRGGVDLRAARAAAGRPRVPSEVIAARQEARAVRLARDAARRQRRVVCSCGVEVAYGNLGRHRRGTHGRESA